MFQLKGIFRYITFGLRQEWIELFFANELEVPQNSSLGPKQKQALYYYLKDIELIADKTKTTPFFQKVKKLSSHSSTHDNFWSFLWVNMSYNAPLFKWYNTLEAGEYSKKELFNLLGDDYGKKNRSVDGACTSLISTFDRTPIGPALKIGKVIKKGNSRIIIKEGGHQFAPLVILYSLFKYAEHHNTYRIPIHEIEHSPLSPQKIFVQDTETIKQAVLSLFKPDFIAIDFDEDKIVFTLNDEKTGLDVIDLIFTS